MKQNTNYQVWRRSIAVLVGLMLLTACHFDQYIDLDGIKLKKIQLLQLDMDLKQLHVDTQALLTQDTEVFDQFEIAFNLFTTQLERYQAGHNNSQLLQEWQQVSVINEELNHRRKYFTAVYQSCEELTEKINLMGVNIDELAAALVATPTDQELIYQVTRMLFVTERMKHALTVIKYGHGEEQVTVVDRLGRDTVILTKQVNEVFWLLGNEKLEKSKMHPLLFRVNKISTMLKAINVAVGGTLERVVEFLSYQEAVEQMQELLAEVDSQLQQELHALEPLSTARE